MLIRKPKVIHEYLSRYVVGQDDAKKVLSNGYFLHGMRSLHSAWNGEVHKKGTILLHGPTGCGKTYLIKKLAELSGLPLLRLQARAIVNSGYKGNSIEDYLEEFVSNVPDNKRSLLPYSIVFIDELDKICVSSGSVAEWDKNIQQSLLTFIEGTQYQIGTNSRSVARPQKVDTSQFMIILAGSFAHLEEQSRFERDEIGFNRAPVKKKYTLLDIQNKFVAGGMIRELAGRITAISELNQLTKHDLRQILLKSEKSVLKEYQELFTFAEKKSVAKITDEQIDQIVERCIAANTGARGLHVALEEMLKDKIYNMKFTGKLKEFGFDKKLKTDDDIKQAQELGAYFFEGDF